MVWTTPMTAVAFTPLSAVEWNMHIRDNLREMLPHKAGSIPAYGVTTGPGSVSMRSPKQDYMPGLEHTASDGATWRDLDNVGPTVTVTTGSVALVWFQAYFSPGSANRSGQISVAVTGASSIAAQTEWGCVWDGTPKEKSNTQAGFYLFENLNPGENVFQMKYKSTNGWFWRRRITVVPLS